MREVEKEIRQRILEAEDMIKLCKKQKDFKKEMFYYGEVLGFTTSLGIIKTMGGKK